MAVEEHTIELAGAPAFYRSAPSEHDPIPVYLHGAPTSSDDWTALLERTGGLAPDLLGFGRSGKGGHLEYSPEALADFVGDLLSELSIGRCQLVLHGWGAAAGALWASRHSEQVERVVIFNAVPLLPGLPWPWWARLLRVPGAGELAMGAITRMVLTRWLRGGSARPETWPASRLSEAWHQFDQGTQRAILRLQRSVDEERQQAMVGALESLRRPTLVIWGERDPWWDTSVLDAYAARLPQARIEWLESAGHWPWLDDPAAIDLVAGFLAGGSDH